MQTSNKLNTTAFREKVTISERDALMAANNAQTATKTKICNDCKKEYMHHPLVSNVRNWKGEPYLTKLCNGLFVKIGE